MTITLPDPNTVKALIVSKPLQEDKPSYDLEALHKEALAAKESIRFKHDISPISKQLYDLVGYEFLRSSAKDWTKRVSIGWNPQWKSITFSFFDGAELKTHLIRKAGDIKWKTYGSKRFTPSRVTDSKIAFIASGIGEYFIFELLGVDYFCLQSDTIQLHEELTTPFQNKSMLIYFEDNDDSGRKLGTKLKAIFGGKLIVKSFEDKERGFDLRDWILKDLNTKDNFWKEIEWLISNQSND